MVKSIKAVIPPHVRLMVSGRSCIHRFPFSFYPTALAELCIIIMTGGVEPENVKAYLEAGATGFALGSTLYEPGLSDEELRRRLETFMKEYRDFQASSSSQKSLDGGHKKDQRQEEEGPLPGQILINPDSGFLGDPLSSPIYG